MTVQSFEWTNWNGKPITISYDPQAAAIPRISRLDDGSPVTLGMEYQMLSNQEVLFHHWQDTAERNGSTYDLTDDNKIILSRINWIETHHPEATTVPS